MSRDYFYTVFQARESSRPKYHIFQNIPETDLMQKKKRKYDLFTSKIGRLQSKNVNKTLKQKCGKRSIHEAQFQN